MKITDHGPHWETMRGRWNRSDSLLGGTETMRKRASTFLPRFPGESAENYTRRKDQATLTNLYKKAAHSMIGNIFRDEVQIAEEIPVEIVEDIDRRGMTINSFAENIAFRLITGGVQGVCVDHPPQVTDNTRLDDKMDARRHYAYLIKPDNVVAAYTVVNAGLESWTHFRYYERGSVEKEGDYKFTERRRIRVWNLDESGAVQWQLWQQKGDSEEDYELVVDGDGASAKPAEGGIDYKKIPIVVGYANPLEREGPYACRPLLDDIAYKNIQHFQFASSQDNILELSAFPERVLKTGDPDAALRSMRGMTSHEAETGKENPTVGRNSGGMKKVGPHQMHVIGQDDELDFIQAPMEGVEAREKRLDKIISDIRLMALDLMTEPGQTATARTFDRLEAMSPLQRIAAETERVVNETLTIMEDWSGKKMGRIKIGRDFGVTQNDALQFKIVDQLYGRGAIGEEEYLAAAKKLAPALSELNVELVAEAARLRANPTFTDETGTVDDPA